MTRKAAYFRLEMKLPGGCRASPNKQMATRNAERINFGKIKEPVVPPNLIEIQVNSYIEFLQTQVSPSKRKNTGLEAVFKEVFPIESYDGKTVLEYTGYEIGEAKLSWLDSIREGLTFGAPLHVTFRLRDETRGAKEEKVFMGELPLMTPQGTFVINGAERVVVSQLIRSPGVYFSAEEDSHTGRKLHSAKLIPNRGAWLEFETSKRDIISVKVDRKRKMPVTVLLRRGEWAQYVLIRPGR